MSAKDALIQRLPATFASVSSINSALTTLWTQDLPDDYYQQYAKRIAAITKDDVVRGWRSSTSPSTTWPSSSSATASVIEGPLKATGIAPIVVYDIDGNPLGQQ